MKTAERARAERFVRAEDRHRFVAQHALLRSLVGELTHGDPSRLDLAYHCPVCGGATTAGPYWNGSVVRLSASRSGQRVVVAVARGDQPIGVTTVVTADPFPLSTAVSDTAVSDPARA